MQAVVYTRYGSADVLHLAEVATPTPGDDEVLVRVHAASVNSWDWDLVTGQPPIYRLMFGLRTPKYPIIGSDIAGRVEAVGSKVTRFQPGDEVFGDISGDRFGAFAEYACANADILARKPASISFEDAAALPQAAVLALQGLRQGELQQGKRVLINGAGGGVGTFAVQLAKASGAEVTGVDSAPKLEMLRTLGADHVIDYAQTDFTRNGQPYDLILDMVARRSVGDYLRALGPGGMLVVVGGRLEAIFQTVTLGAWLARRQQKGMGLLLHKPDASDLEHLTGLVAAGTLVPIIDRYCPLGETAEAVRRLGAGEVKGKVVITVG